MTSVAVAVNSGAGFGGKGSRRAVRWAAQNLLPKADRFVLIHVIPTVTAVPTPSDGKIPVEELDERVVALYVEEVKLKVAEILSVQAIMQREMLLTCATSFIIYKNVITEISLPSSLDTAPLPLCASTPQATATACLQTLQTRHSFSSNVVKYCTSYLVRILRERRG